VEQLMSREAQSLLAAPQGLRIGAPEFEPELEKTDNPDAPAVSQWPQGFSLSPDEILSPQTVATNFLGISLQPPSFPESGSIPPDSMGDVGPTQIFMASNGRFKVFDKAGTLGALNVSDTTFWASVANGATISDPEIRYDRLSGRWFVLAVNIPSGLVNNRV